MMPVTEAQLRVAIAEHAADFAGLPLAPLSHGGTETRVYRLGDRHLLRIPLRAESAPAFENEVDCLNHLHGIGPDLPLAMPHVEATGRVDTNPPLPWAIQRWIEGRDATVATPADPFDMADRLARFLLALQKTSTPKNATEARRGGPLAPQDSAFRSALADARTKGLTGLDPAVAAWEAGLAAPLWGGAPVWIHGDLVPGNLILSQGRLTGIIDWSYATLGDPAYDLIPAWFVFDRPAGQRFLDQMDPDPATILRARARVAWQCVLALPYYLDTNPAMVRLARRGLAALKSDLT